MKEIIDALRAFTSQFTWPHFLVVAVMALFIAGFKHVTSWQGVGYLLCLGLGVILLGGLSRLMYTCRRPDRHSRQQHPQNDRCPSGDSKRIDRVHRDDHDQAHDSRLTGEFRRED